MVLEDFRGLTHFKLAMTHSSYCREHNLSLNECNERLEFLGDAVLKLAISSFLFEQLPDAREGCLTKLHSEIVSNKNLEKFARQLNLNDMLILSTNEEKMGGREKSSLLSCAFEALLGAIFLEHGYEKVR